MLALLERVARIVTGRPGLTIAGVLLLTGVLGWYASQSVQEDGVAVDNELSQALERIDDTFGEPRSVLQVLVERTDGGDVRSVEALEASLAIQEAVDRSPSGDTLAGDGQQPPVASFLGGAELALAMDGATIDELDDQAVRDLQAGALEQLPAQVAGLFEGLLADGEPPSAGLILFFQDTAGLTEEQTLQRQRDLAAVIDDVEVGQGLSVDPFSFGLLLTAGDPGPEIGRLFATAFLIILLVLFIVYWLRPEGATRLRVGRRTAADVGLTLAVIALAVVWMQGIGVLLGPDHLGLIGYFSAQTQIVPILIIGLGVDFAIHLLARYRTEVGGGADPVAAYRAATRTVGLALLLCTAATAIGFLTNLASPVDFLATLGVLAATGIAAAFVLTMTLLPAVRTLLDRRGAARGTLPVAALGSQTERTLPRVIGRTAWLAERAPVPTLLAATLLVGVGGYGFTQLDSEFNLTDFVPQDEPLLEVFERIDSGFDGGFEESTEVLLDGDLASPDAHDALVASLERAADVPSVETLGGAPDATSPVSVLARALEDDRLAAQLRELGVQDDLTMAADADVEEVYEVLLAQTDQGGAVLAPDDGLARVTFRTSAGQNGAAALAEDLGEAFAPLRDAGVDVTPTSQQIVQARIGTDIEDTQLTSLLIALGAAMLLLVVHFWFAVRRPVLGVVTVLPVGLVLALTFGTMALTGIPLNPVTATLAALSIGIGVPFTIHVTARFLEERQRTTPGHRPIRRTVAETGGALAGSALTTAIGFGVLTTSTLLPFEQLGYVIVFAIVYSVVAAVLVLPSMLVLWDRLDRSRHGQPTVAAPADEPRDAPVGTA